MKRKNEKRLTWLHLSDLHVGAPGEELFIPKIVPALKEDLPRCIKWSSEPRFVVITGDLTYSGEKHQYKRLDEYLGKIWTILGKELPLFTVPGNHDVCRVPSSYHKYLWLSEYHSASQPDSPMKIIKEELWKESPTETRESIESMFDTYDKYERRHAPKTRSQHVKSKYGFLHCDYLAKFRREGFNIAIAGFNSTWRQFGPGKFKGKVSIDRYQAHHLFPSGFSEDCSNQDLRIVLQHHPPDWLENQEDWQNFVCKDAHVVLCGHTHKNHQIIISKYGEEYSLVQTCSLCGIKNFGEGKKETRAFGYTIESLTLDNGGNYELRAFPRVLNDQFRFVKDSKFSKPEDEGEIVAKYSSNRSSHATVRNRINTKPSGTAGRKITIRKSSKQLGPKTIYGDAVLLEKFEAFASKKTEKMMEDRTQFQLLVASWEIVAFFVDRPKLLTEDDSRFLQILLEFPMAESGAIPIDELAEFYKNKWGNSRPHYQPFVEIIRQFKSSTERQNLGSLLLNWRESFANLHKTGIDHYVTQMWASCAINVALRTHDTGQKEKLLHEVKRLLGSRKDPLSLHLRGLVEFLYGNTNNCHKLWSGILKSRTIPRSILRMNTNVQAKLADLYQELAAGAEMNIALIRFANTAKRVLRDTLATSYLNIFSNDLLNLPTDQPSSEYITSQFVDQSLTWTPRIVDAINSVIGNRAQVDLIEEFMDASKEILEITSRVTIRKKNIAFSDDFWEQIELHRAQAQWVLNGEHGSKNCRFMTGKELPDVRRYSEFMINNLWTPEQVWLDIAHTFTFYHNLIRASVVDMPKQELVHEENASLILDVSGKEEHQD